MNDRIKKEYKIRKNISQIYEIFVFAVKTKYSKTLIAGTLMANLPWLTVNP